MNYDFVLDYIFVTIIGFIPIIIANAIDIWNPVLKEGDTTLLFKRTGFSEAHNSLALVVILPSALFLLRRSSKLMFGIAKNVPLEKVPILNKFQHKPKIQRIIHNKLQNLVVNPILPFVICCINIVFHYFDLKEIINQYYIGFSGKIPDSKAVQTYIYWANLWIVIPDRVSITTNLIFALIVYCIQFFAVFIALTGIAIFFLYNIFYMNRIYQRSKVKKNSKFSKILYSLKF